MTTMRAEFDVHVMVRELTEPYEHREPYTVEDEAGTSWSSVRRVEALSLVDQLLHVTGAGPGSGSQSGTVPHSRPELPVERHDLLGEMDRMAAGWIRYLGGELPAATWVGTRRVRGSLEKAKLTRLHGLLPSARHCTGLRWSWDPDTEWCCDAHTVEFLLSGWWHRARVLLGWEPSSVWRQHNTCPRCGRKGLVVTVVAGAEHGSCSHCPAVFAGDDWRLLLLHIRIENDLTREDNER